MMDGDLFFPVVKHHRRLVRFESQAPADRPGGRRVAVVVEADGKVLVHQEGGAFPAVGQQRRQVSQADPGETVDGSVPRGLMDSHIADAVPPLIDLSLDVHKISEGTQGPEDLAEVIYAFLDFSLFLGRPDVTGAGNDLEDPQKNQEGVIETDDAAAAA